MYKEQTTLIMPCAGKSTRFATTRPKWMLTHPSGDLMFIEALSALNLAQVKEVIVVVVKEHVEKHCINLPKISEQFLRKKNKNLRFLILDQFTSSQSETVYSAIEQLGIEGSIFIKDCDNSFDTMPQGNNEICTTYLQSDTNSINKSYVKLDQYGFVSSIIEKQVVCNQFCVGGYSFAEAQEFSNAFNVLRKTIQSQEIYISHIIQYMILQGAKFDAIEVSNYTDWGTLEDWNKYTSQFQTLFIDLDGVLVQNSSQFFEHEWGCSDSLQDNVDIVNRLYDLGKTTIIITTSRSTEYKEKTIDQLQRCGIKYHNIIFDLPHAKRIVINDYSDSNPYPTSLCINLRRNADDLKDYLSIFSSRKNAHK